MSARTSPAEAFEKIPTVLFGHAPEAAAALAREVRDLILARRAAGRPTVLGLATGSTPVPFYRELIRLHKEEGLSFHDVIIISTSAPIDVTQDRTAIEKVDPKNVSISVTSAVSRDTASPVLSFEKYAGDSDISRA